MLVKAVVEYRELNDRAPKPSAATNTQLGRVPLHAATPEEFASYLVKFQIRRDEERQGTLQKLIDIDAVLAQVSGAACAVQPAWRSRPTARLLLPHGSIRLSRQKLAASRGAIPPSH